MNRSSGLPVVHIKREPTDFVVRERLGFELDGSGEHAYFHIRKTGWNTADVARELAVALGLRPADIGYAGMKDRHGVTDQWFSAPVQTNEWPLMLAGVECLACGRHARKLRRGDHAGNHFILRLRDAAQNLTAQLRGLSAGFPNYFGAQRVSAANVQRALDFFAQGENTRVAPRRRGRRRQVDPRRSWHLSVARSYLFNKVLDVRVAMDSYQQSVPGDVLHNGLPTAPLWGRGRSAASGQALDIEQQALQADAALCEALEFSGLQQQRRIMCATPAQLSVQQEEDGSLLLSFDLGPGVYATSMLSHVADVVDDAAVRRQGVGGVRSDGR